jgi:hypothetical protein
MSRRTPPARITEAELRALRACVDEVAFDPRLAGPDDATVKAARRALDKLSGLPTKLAGDEPR